MKDAITILDVANKAKVSPATVTHTLNGKRPVKESTRKKVLSTIKELGYVPSWNASRLKSGSSGIIGCLTVDITELFVSRMVKGIESALGNGKYSLLFVSAVEFEGDLVSAYNSLKSHNVDGILLCYHIPGDDNVLKDIVPFCPTVFLNMALPGFESIVLDNISGGLMAADHLVSCGVRHPAIICGPEKRYSTIDRLEGFSRRMKELSIDLAEENISFGEYNAEHGFDSVKKMFSKDKNIDGIFCENDYLAAGAINAVKSLGMEVPSDVKIIGFDNRDFSSFWSPSISTFEIPFHDMGMIGMFKLKEKIENKNSIQVSKIQLQPKIIIRDSTSLKVK